MMMIAGSSWVYFGGEEMGGGEGARYDYLIILCACFLALRNVR